MIAAKKVQPRDEGPIPRQLLAGADRRFDGQNSLTLLNSPRSGQ
jgi:hypothetical protein